MINTLRFFFLLSIFSPARDDSFSLSTRISTLASVEGVIVFKSGCLHCVHAESLINAASLSDISRASSIEITLVSIIFDAGTDCARGVGVAGTGVTVSEFFVLSWSKDSSVSF